MTVGADAEHIALAGTPQGHLDIADAVNAVGCDPAKRNICGERLADHFHGERRLCREGYSVRNMGRRHPDWVVRPGLGQIQRPVDEGMAVARHISAEHADLAVRDLARRPRVLTSDAAGGLALLQKPGLIQNKNRIRIGQGLQRIVTHDVAQRVSVPPSSTQNGLLAPGTGIASRFRTHPAGLAPLISE